VRERGTGVVLFVAGRRFDQFDDLAVPQPVEDDARVRVLVRVRQRPNLNIDTVTRSSRSFRKVGRALASEPKHAIPVGRA
jgi:hypothetical protein